MSQNKTEVLKKVKKLNQIIRKHHPHIEDNDWAYLSMYLDQWFELTKVTISLIDEKEEPKKITKQQKKLKHLLDKCATDIKMFTGNTEEMEQIEQHLNTKEVLKREDLTKIWDYLCDMEKTSGCVKLYTQCLIGQLIKIYLQEKGVEASISFFGKSKSQLYKYVKLTELLTNFPKLSVIGADFTLLVQNNGFIKDYITQMNYNFGNISLDAKITVINQLLKYTILKPFQTCEIKNWYIQMFKVTEVLKLWK